MKRAVDEKWLDISNISTVLDFGSAHGENTVFPLHVLKPDLHVIATDISPHLLCSLSRILDSYAHAANVDIVAWDCMSGGIVPGAFDLVTGVSVLHHLLDPRLALRSAFEALRPGGFALFIEPFDGAGLIRGLYEMLLATNIGHNERLSDGTTQALVALSRDYAARLGGTEPSDFVNLEDKWIFAPEQMTSWALDAGFHSARIKGNQPHQRMYRNYVETQLRIAAGPGAAQLPGWATDMLDRFDDSLPESLRNRMLLEGTVVMRK